MGCHGRRGLPKVLDGGGNAEVSGYTMVCSRDASGRPAALRPGRDDRRPRTSSRAVADLALCRDLLEPGGLLVVATCDIGSFAARYYGLRWRQLVISHTYYWTNACRYGSRWTERGSTRSSSPRCALGPRSDFGAQTLGARVVKLFGRKALQIGWMPLARRSRTLREAPTAEADPRQARLWPAPTQGWGPSIDGRRCAGRRRRRT